MLELAVADGKVDVQEAKLGSSKVHAKYESAADSAILKSLELAKRSGRFGKVSQG